MFLFALVFFFLFFLFIDYFFEAIYPFAVRSGVNRAHTVRVAVTSSCSLASAMRNALPIWVYTCVTEISLDFFFTLLCIFSFFFFNLSPFHHRVLRSQSCRTLHHASLYTFAFMYIIILFSSITIYIYFCRLSIVSFSHKHSYIFHRQRTRIKGDL